MPRAPAYQQTATRGRFSTRRCRHCHIFLEMNFLSLSPQCSPALFRLCSQLQNENGVKTVVGASLQPPISGEATSRRRRERRGMKGCLTETRAQRAAWRDAECPAGCSQTSCQSGSRGTGLLPWRGHLCGASVGYGARGCY